MKISASSITIDDVFPWGRSFDEYRRMFSLSERDLNGRILSCADGPASFNAEMTARGRRVVSCDPLYRFSAAEIQSRVEATRDLMVDLVTKDAGRFCWDRIKSPKEMGRLRMNAMTQFITDFAAGKDAGRYLDESLPQLSFADKTFDLAVCSHFLFLYSREFSLEFHLAALFEMSRVAKEVRVFPLLDMQSNPSVHVESVMARFRETELIIQVETVDYEFQRGGNQMLRIRKSTTC